MKFKIERTKFGGYQAVLYDGKDPLFTSPVFAAKISAQRAVDALRENAADAEVVEV